MASVLAAGRGAVASHSTAGRLHGFPALPERHEVTILAVRKATLTGGAVHRSRLLVPEDCSQARLVPVTTALRTTFDLAAQYRKPRIARILDSALIHKLCTRADVEAQLECLRARGRDAPLIAQLLAQRPVSGRPIGSDLEAEGFIWHGHRTAWERDRARDHRLIAVGWTLIPLTWGLVHGNPRTLAELVRRALAARS